MDHKRISNKPTVSYTLFLYREELQRRNRHYLKLSKTKVLLTDKLISKTVKNIQACTVEDLKITNREMHFRQKLCEHIKRTRKMEKRSFRTQFVISL